MTKLALSHRQAGGKRPASRLRVGFILAPRFTLCAFANFVDVLRLAADEGDRSRPINCSWEILSGSMNPISSSCGVAIQPQERLGDPSRFDYIVVVGGLIGAAEKLHADDIAFLRYAAEKNIPLIGICTGAFILHNAGLMRGYQCCVSWFHHDDFLMEFDGLEPVSDQIFVLDRDRLTCAGGASSAHLAAFLVERHVSAAAAQKSLRIMIIDDAMTGDYPQPNLPGELKTGDTLVKRALSRMQQTMASPMPVSALAAHLGVGRRKLERHFEAYLGMTPAKANKKIRLAQARHLLRQNKYSITRIANETGFCDVSHFINVFRSTEGVTPDTWRRQGS